jgi:hypothetical protein
MKIKFLVDYRGRETGENFFRKGEVADLDPEGATFLIQDGRAVADEGIAKKMVKETAPKPTKPTTPKPVNETSSKTTKPNGSKPVKENSTKPVMGQGELLAVHPGGVGDL